MVSRQVGLYKSSIFLVTFESSLHTTVFLCSCIIYSLSYIPTLGMVCCRNILGGVSTTLSPKTVYIRYLINSYNNTSIWSFLVPGWFCLLHWNETMIHLIQSSLLQWVMDRALYQPLWPFLSHSLQQSKGRETEYFMWKENDDQLSPTHAYYTSCLLLLCFFVFFYRSMLIDPTFILVE